MLIFSPMFEKRDERSIRHFRSRHQKLEPMLMDIQYGNERQKSSNRRLKPIVIHAGTLHMKDTNLTQETRRNEKQLTTMSLYYAHWLQHVNSPRWRTA